MTDLTAMPLQVRIAAKVCACSHLEQEHDLSPVRGRTRCSHLGCDCAGWTHTVDRYAVSTYVDVLVGEAAPTVELRDTSGACSYVDPTGLRCTVPAMQRHQHGLPGRTPSLDAEGRFL